MLDKYSGLLKDMDEIGSLATFVPNKALPVYNWLYYKEGFSRDLVFLLIEKLGLHSGQTILDPFCGSGTTLAACREKGISGIGADVLPISVFSSIAKTRNYDAERLMDISRLLFSKRFERIPAGFPAVMRRAFSKYALEDISFFIRELNRIEDEDARNFFMLALINAAVKVSYARKDGAVIKFRKARKPPLRFMFKRIASRMIKDMQKTMFPGPECDVFHGDARKLPVEDSSIDAVITSPPYLNQIDYTKVYEIENFFLQGDEKPAVRSYIGLGADAEFLPELNLPASAMAYFRDMGMALKEMFRVCREGSGVSMVVGNAYFPGMIVDSDLILSYLAEETGFIVDEIWVLNKRFALEERTKKKGVLRESAIIMRK